MICLKILGIVKADKGLTVSDTGQTRSDNV